MREPAGQRIRRVTAGVVGTDAGPRNTSGSASHRHAIKSGRGSPARSGNGSKAPRVRSLSDGCGSGGAGRGEPSRARLGHLLPPSFGRRVFIFSTSGVSRKNAPGFGADDPHLALRERLVAKGCEIIGEFNCVGYNDNSFLFLVGGMNRGRPNAKDIALAEAFADSLLEGGNR
jgi:hypothetical protein